MQNLKGEFKELALENLHISEYHERSIWNLPELKKQIEDSGGIKIPLIVRARARKLGGYEILDGARRKRAGEMAGLVKAPCIVVEVDDATAIAMQMDANGERVPLHPVDEAGIFKRLVALGWDEGQIAKRFHRKRPEIARRLKLNALSGKARAAFVDGKIDEEGALALALLDTSARQNGYIDAIASGSLQPEELVSTVRRQQSAQLDDIPWSVSDAKLYAKAGACTTCPKRASVQRPLFPDLEAGERCLDVVCWRQKMDLSYEAARKRPGIQVLRDRAEALFMPESGARPSLLQNSGKVDAEATCPYVKRGTWDAAVGKAAPADAPPVLFLAKDQDGRPRWLFDEAAVVKLVKRGDEARIQKESAREADPVKSDPEADAAREAARVRSAQVAEVYETALSGDHDVLAWIVERIIDDATGKDSAHAVGKLESSSKGEDVKASEDPKEWLRELARRSKLWAKRVALAILIREADEGDAFPETLAELAKIVGADIKGAARKARKEPAPTEESGEAK